MRDYQELESAVSRGADLLDSTDSEWPSKVDLLELNMSSCSKCVLGHLYGDYWDACKVLMDEAAGPDFGVFHGFDIDAEAIIAAHPGYENREVRRDERAAEYQTLKDLWIKQINRRLG